ncbi:molybdopterin-dependent oxidoreductase [Klebsiella pneumoniae]
MAREIGMSKPAYICQGWGPQRQANGELTARAIAMLPILTGNVGINGGNSGARESTYTITIERLPVLENPVKTAISCFTWTDAIARGPEMTASRDGVGPGKAGDGGLHRVFQHRQALNGDGVG